MSEIDQLLSDRAAIRKLPHSKCRNCGGDLHLYKRRWYHISMVGGEYYRPNTCHNPQPLRCKTCGGKIDYRTTQAGYYDFKCQSCIAEWHKGDKIGDITIELRRQLERGVHDYLKYGTSCSVVLTKDGIYFEDIC